MRKLLRFFLVIQFLGWLGAIISSFSGNIFTLIIPLIVNFIVGFLLWRGLDFTISSPETGAKSKKANIIRWLLSFNFSIFATQIGIIIAFIVRFFIDQGYVQGNPLATAIVDGSGKQFGNTIIEIGILLSFPIMFLANKTLRFSKPLIPTAIFGLFWFFLIIILGPLIKI